MKKRIVELVLIVLCIGMTLASCGNGEFEDLELDVPQITVTSLSISAEGKLLTKTAANKNPNNPKGENKSPHAEWGSVDGAACYAVVIFDTTANWLHMFIPVINGTEIEEGKFTATSDYIGAYPPKNSGTHEYRIEVFALKEKPHNLVFIIDKKQSYKDIVKALDRKNARDGNILARGYIIATYSHGDNTAN